MAAKCGNNKCGRHAPDLRNGCQHWNTMLHQECGFIDAAKPRPSGSTEFGGCEAKVWVLTRWIKEKYVVLGETRHEAIAAIDDGQGPYEITVTKETCVPD